MNKKSKVLISIMSAVGLSSIIPSVVVATISNQNASYLNNNNNNNQYALMSQSDWDNNRPFLFEGKQYSSIEQAVDEYMKKYGDIKEKQFVGTLNESNIDSKTGLLLPSNKYRPYDINKLKQAYFTSNNTATSSRQEAVDSFINRSTLFPYYYDYKGNYFIDEVSAQNSIGNFSTLPISYYEFGNKKINPLNLNDQNRLKDIAWKSLLAGSQDSAFGIDAIIKDLNGDYINARSIKSFTDEYSDFLRRFELNLNLKINQLITDYITNSGDEIFNLKIFLKPYAWDEESNNLKDSKDKISDSSASFTTLLTYKFYDSNDDKGSSYIDSQEPMSFNVLQKFCDIFTSRSWFKSYFTIDTTKVHMDSGFSPNMERKATLKWQDDYYTREFRRCFPKFDKLYSNANQPVSYNNAAKDHTVVKILTKSDSYTEWMGPQYPNKTELQFGLVPSITSQGSKNILNYVCENLTSDNGKLLNKVISDSINSSWDKNFIDIMNNFSDNLFDLILINNDSVIGYSLNIKEYIEWIKNNQHSSKVNNYSFDKYNNEYGFIWKEFVNQYAPFFKYENMAKEMETTDLVKEPHIDRNIRLMLENGSYSCGSFAGSKAELGKKHITSHNEYFSTLSQNSVRKQNSFLDNFLGINLRSNIKNNQYIEYKDIALAQFSNAKILSTDLFALFKFKNNPASHYKEYSDKIYKQDSSNNGKPNQNKVIKDIFQIIEDQTYFFSLSEANKNYFDVFITFNSIPLYKINENYLFSSQEDENKAIKDNNLSNKNKKLFLNIINNYINNVNLGNMASNESINNAISNLFDNVSGNVVFDNINVYFGNSWKVDYSKNVIDFKKNEIKFNPNYTYVNQDRLLIPELSANKQYNSHGIVDAIKQYNKSYNRILLGSFDSNDDPFLNDKTITMDNLKDVPILYSYANSEKTQFKYYDMTFAKVIEGKDYFNCSFEIMNESQNYAITKNQLENVKEYVATFTKPLKVWVIIANNKRIFTSFNTLPDSNSPNFIDNADLVLANAKKSFEIFANPNYVIYLDENEQTNKIEELCLENNVFIAYKVMINNQENYFRNKDYAINAIKEYIKLNSYLIIKG